MRLLRGVLMVGLFSVAFIATAGLNGQEPKPKVDPKAEPKTKVDPKAEPKAKGQLPQNWGALGLTADQKDKVYKLQAKYNTDIDKLEAQIKEMKEKLRVERLEILTAEQKKALEDILKKKSGN